MDRTRTMKREKKYTVRTEKYPTGEKFATVFEQNHPVLRKKSLSKSPEVS